MPTNSATNGEREKLIDDILEMVDDRMPDDTWFAAELADYILAQKAQTAQAVIAKVLELIEESYQPSLSDLELYEHQHETEKPIISKTEIRLKVSALLAACQAATEGERGKDV